MVLPRSRIIPVEMKLKRYRRTADAIPNLTDKSRVGYRNTAAAFSGARIYGRHAKYLLLLIILDLVTYDMLLKS
jgi:hypothetical protein